jgi:hypothetical protein
MTKEKIEIQMLPERGVGKRLPGEVLVLFAENEEASYVVYHTFSSVADRKTIIRQAKLELDARRKNGQMTKNFRFERMSEKEAVDKGILPGIDRVDIPPRE